MSMFDMCVFDISISGKHTCHRVIRPGCCLLLLVCLLLSVTPVWADNESGFGRPLSNDEVASIPKHVFADGTGLPEGEGDSDQGKQLYTQHCADCHGSVGQGGRAVELVGDRALLATDIPDKGIAVYWPYAPTLFEYVRRAMPPDKPYSLTVNEVYATVAYLLELNGLAEPDVSVDAEFLSNLKMPNLDGFQPARTPCSMFKWCRFVDNFQ